MSKSYKEQLAELYEDLSSHYDKRPYGEYGELTGKDHNDAYDRIIESVRGDGGSTNYYELPDGATELRHLIKHKKMEHGIGEAFCALYRLNDNGEYLRNLKKAKFYIDAEIEYEESK